MAKMAKQRNTLLILVVFLSTILAACGAAPKPTPGPAKGLLFLDCEVADAEIWLDSRFLGEVREVKGGIRLGPGLRRIEVRHSDYHSTYLEIELRPDQTRRLDVELARRLP